jgi:two-component system, cell cycle response regulator DivK
MYAYRNKVLYAGCTACFEKPIDPLTILDKIHAFLGLKGNNATVSEEH